MKTLMLTTLSILAVASATALAENRCGWIENPTPGNYFLTDRDASWTIMTQGGPSAEGSDLIGDLSSGDYVMTNGYYGYGCACAEVETEESERRITVLHSFRQIPLSRCENDNNLGAPGQ